MSPVNAPHHFITQGGKEILALEVNEVDPEAGFTDADLGSGRDLSASGIKGDIKVVVTPGDIKSNFFVIGNYNRSHREIVRGNRRDDKVV